MNGGDIFKAGKTYKECKNAKELNEFTKEERNSRVGFHYNSWCKMGRVCGSELKVSIK